MAFDPQSIQDAINRAGSLLHEKWKKPGSMPENDLNPDPSAIQFQVRLLSDRLDLLEKTVGELVRALNGRK